MELKKKGSPVVESCLADGLIVNCTAEKVIRLVPPLIVTEAEIDKAVAILDKALTKF
jgi:acetylornithine/succinyldiaminopimelate/putrescine aminotransferase